MVIQTRSDRRSPLNLDGGRRRFRLDIQGLRGIAVLSVVLYHSSVPFVTGGYVGVDVFFVISGFLITSHLFDELDSSGRISLIRFYARRARRLLVPALLCIIVTIALAWKFGPPLSTSSTAKDGMFASVYLTNYRLAALAVDYQHAGATASPLQHYWSLAVEEQFYIIWPALMIIAVWVFRRANRRVVIGALVGSIGVLSLTLSILWTPQNASYSYFSLQTRAWELAAGAAIALAMPLLGRASAGPAAICTWLGLGLILLSIVFYTDNTPFPGYFAIIPVLGAALVIACGVAGPQRGAQLLLRNSGLQFLGKVSYAWYLWHWPAVILGPFVLHRSVGTLGKLGLSAVALGVAWLTVVLLEAPLQRSRLVPARWLATAAIAAICGIGVSAGAYRIPPLHVTGAPAAPVELGNSPETQLHDLATRAVSNESVPRNLTPGLLNAQTQGRTACLAQFTERMKRCTFGNPDAARTTVLFGDSHADEWTPVLSDLAKSNDWRLIVLTKVGCPLADLTVYDPQLHRTYTECTTWRGQALRTIALLHPDTVLVSQSNTIAATQFTDTQWADATKRTLAKLAPVTRHLIYLGDTPHPPSSVPECLAAHLSSAAKCNFANPTTTGATGPQAVQNQRQPGIESAVTSLGVRYLPTADWFCVANTCPPIIGNVLIYRDDSHISSSASRMVAALIARDILPPLK